MLNDIKKILGINNTDFDTILNNYIESAKTDLKSVGIASSLINLLKDGATIPTNEERHLLIKTAVITYVQYQYDIENRASYYESYEMQKDNLRKKQDYQEPQVIEEAE